MLNNDNAKQCLNMLRNVVIALKSNFGLKVKMAKTLNVELG